MKRIALTRLRLGTRGTAAIEFAILAPPFLMLALGVYEFGRALWTLEALQESATQGARCIGVHATSCWTNDDMDATATTAYVQGVAQGWGIGVPAADIVPTKTTSCGTVPGFSTVQITYQFSTVVGSLIPALANQTITANACFPLNP